MAQIEAAPAAAVLKRTPLHDVHVGLKARMVPFGGWDMPVQYPTGVLAEHHAVRQRAGLFDIGHMGQLAFAGPDALEYLQWVTTHDVSRLAIGAAQYSLLCNYDGGVLDDIIVYRLAEQRYLMIVNAANADADYAWLEGQLERPGRGVDPERVRMQRLSPGRTLLALQGPLATQVLGRLTDAPFAELANYHAVEATLDGVPALIARTGYTGERGYEIAFDGAQATRIWNALLQAGQHPSTDATDGAPAPPDVIPCGLGARDTLRLEAGMALYSHELTTETNPFEAGLERVVRFEKGNFVGAAALSQVQATGPQRKLVGLELIDRGVPRAGYPIISAGKAVGTLTSGGPSPTLATSIGMGYVPAALAVEGTEVQIDIRGRPHAARTVRLPFYRRQRRRERED
ncbi:MAG: glycine cleavage system aminomethyltransferase GcvT [Chloroflexota bacterium]|nr:glycine cleavage system aminomethyltransferase GcvT [Chloroflexota bacterium]